MIKQSLSHFIKSDGLIKRIFKITLRAIDKAHQHQHLITKEKFDRKRRLNNRFVPKDKNNAVKGLLSDPDFLDGHNIFQVSFLEFSISRNID